MTLEKLSDRLLDIGNHLLVAFPVERVEIEGSTYITSRIFIFKVAAFWPYWYKYSLGAMSAGSYKTFNYLGETGFGSGKDIFRIEKDDFHVYHVGLVPDNPNLRVYRTVSPDGDALTALDRKAAVDFASVTAGSNFDYYDSKRIPDKFDPPAFTEWLIFRAASDDDGKYFFYGFYAEKDIPAPNDLYIVGRGYKLLPVTDEDEKKKILEESIKRPELRTVKTTTVTINGIGKTTVTLDKFIPDSWQKVGCDIVYKG